MTVATVVRVMSFNVRGALSWDGINSWPFRRRLIADLLARHRPTVAGFQEVLWSVERFLAAQLPHHRAVAGLPTGTRLISARNPILFSPPLDRTADGAFWLSATPDRRSRSWGALMVRSATWLALSHGDRPLLFMNVHLDHGPDEARLRAGELILDRLRALGWPALPAVLCGDFNCNAGTALHALLLAAGFRDTFLDSGKVDDDATVTSHHFQGRAVGVDRRIDWILASPPLRTVAAAILRDASPPRYPSDHYPVIADLDWAP